MPRSNAKIIANEIAKQVGNDWFFYRDLDECDMFYPAMMNALRNAGLAKGKIVFSGVKQWKLSNLDFFK